MSKSDKDKNYQLSRRSLIKWSLFAGASLGLARGTICEVLAKSAGNAVADAAEDGAAGFFIGCQAGRGGNANFNLLWPQVCLLGQDRASLGGEVMVQGTNKPLIASHSAPWKDLPSSRQVSVFMAGTSQTHSETPILTTLSGGPLAATIAALQTTRSSVVPFVTVSGATYGDVQGAPPVAEVASADGLVALFTATAARAGNVLEKSEDADLFRSRYDALTSLNRAANRPTTTLGYKTSRVAAQLLGRDLSKQLAITDEDLQRYGVDGGTDALIVTMVRGFIAAVKVFKLGLTNGVVLPTIQNDPHFIFPNKVAEGFAKSLQLALDGLMTDLKNNTVNGKSLADMTTIAMWGDNPKNPFVPKTANWQDAPPNNSNWLWVYGAGYLKSGWFGGADLDSPIPRGFDPATGNDIAYNPTQTMHAATAAIAYAVARGDQERVKEVAGNLDISGLVNPVLT